MNFNILEIRDTKTVKCYYIAKKQKNPKKTKKSER